MSLHTRRRRLQLSVSAAIWLTIVWVLLWGDLTVANVVVGLVIALLVEYTLRMPTPDFRGRVHLRSLIYLIVMFLRDLVVASVQVVRIAFDPGRRPLSAVIGVRLRSSVDLYMTLTAEFTSLVPGTVVVEVHRATSMLYVHVLDIGIARGLGAARAQVLDTEARILRALASAEELAAAGLARTPSARQPGEVTG